MKFYNRIFLKENEIDYCLIKRCINKDTNKYVWFKMSSKNFKRNISRLEAKRYYKNNMYYARTILDVPIDKSLIIVLKDGSWIEFDDYIGCGGMHEDSLYFQVPTFKPDRYNLVKKFYVLDACYIREDDDIDKFVKGIPIKEETPEEPVKTGFFTKIINFIKGKK